MGRFWTRREMMGVAAAAPILSSWPARAGNGISEPSLAQAARRQGRVFGAAARADQIAEDRALATAFERDCSCIVPEIHMKWDALEPEQGRYSFEAAERLVEFAAAHDAMVRGHTLLWDQSTPAWVRQKLKQANGWAWIERHFEAALGRFRGRVAEWDVVNEPIAADGDGLRDNLFHRAFGPDYVADALHLARRFDPDARLIVNDYGFDYDNPVEEARRDAFLALVSRLKREGAPIDGVGIQAHLDLSKGPFNPATLRRFLADLAAMDLTIVITELDVKETDMAAPVTLRDARVAAEVTAYLDVALDQPAVTGVVTWGLSDRHSWLQDQSSGPPAADRAHDLNRGLPYDAALAPKPMYWAMRDAFAARG